MKKPTWIVFDVGDVLLDWKSSSKNLADFLGVTQDELLDALFTYADEMFVGRISPVDGWAKVLKKLGKYNDPWEIILRWRDKSFWLEPTLLLVKDLHNRGYSLALMSNSWLGLTEKKDFDKLPKEMQLFKYIFDSSKEKMKKPDPSFYDLVESRVGSVGDSILLVDDSVSNFVPAQEKGWQVYEYIILHDDGLAASEALRKILL